jgi:predicted RND superfamily exporter protein
MRILRFFSNKIAFIFFFTLFLMIFSRFLVENLVETHKETVKSSTNEQYMTNLGE